MNLYTGQGLYEFYMSSDEKPWVMSFEDVCAGIALELGRNPPLDQLREALRKYYNEECFWRFDSVAGVMAEQILNELTK